MALLNTIYMPCEHHKCDCSRSNDSGPLIIRVVTQSEGCNTVIGVVFYTNTWAVFWPLRGG